MRPYLMVNDKMKSNKHTRWSVPPNTVYLISLGCAKNLVDSEIILGALLKEYLVAESSLSAGPGKKTKARELAVVIWARALRGDFQYVQFITDRFMGKQKENSEPDQEAIDLQLARIADGLLMPAIQA